MLVSDGLQADRLSKRKGDICLSDLSCCAWSWTQKNTEVQSVVNTENNAVDAKEIIGELWV